MFDEITSLISNLGFPIAMCVYMVYRNEKVHKRHEQEITKLANIIKDVTVAITKLTDKIETELLKRVEEDREEENK